MTPPTPGSVSPALVAAVGRWLAPAVRALFRPTLMGLEHLPARGPFLLVANHSAGLGVAELMAFAALYLGRFGAERPLAAFAHPIDFRVAAIGRCFRALGAVPATYEGAAEALNAGVPLLVFPGGDHETMRPVWQAGRVDFGGRKGFLKIARAFAVSVVPMGIRGSHFTAPVLWRSRALPWALVLPRLAGLKRWPLTVLGVAVAAAIACLPWSWPARLAAVWAWLASPLTMLPWVPWTLSLEVGPAIAPEVLFRDEDPDLDAALATVEGAVQRIVAGGSAAER